MLLDRYLPNYFVREVHHFAVRASVVDAYRELCNFDMKSVPWVKNLFRLRTLFDRGTEESGLTLRDAYRKGSFILLEEVENRELVVGAIGKIWRPVIPFQKVEPNEFASFHQHGFGKVAWSLSCEERIGGGTLITFEVRVGATDSFSTARMRAYFALIGPFSRAIRRTTLGIQCKRLGDLYIEESTKELPGDSIIESPAATYTHGITIEATPEAIWPWLVQMGCLRGGWYSYDWLDNGGLPSASRIVPQWQTLKVGDPLHMTPDASGEFFVVGLDPEKSLVLGTCVDALTGKSFPPDCKLLPREYFRSTWAFILEPQTSGVTRLIVRAQGDYTHTPNLRTRLIGPIHHFMEQKQLRNLKQRAESVYLMSKVA